MAKCPTPGCGPDSCFPACAPTPPPEREVQDGQAVPTSDGVMRFFRTCSEIIALYVVFMVGHFLIHQQMPDKSTMAFLFSIYAIWSIKESKHGK